MSKGPEKQGERKARWAMEEKNLKILQKESREKFLLVESDPYMPGMVMSEIVLGHLCSVLKLLLLFSIHCILSHHAVLTSKRQSKWAAGHSHVEMVLYRGTEGERTAARSVARGVSRNWKCRGGQLGTLEL